uniref:ZZ-type domain-containing protein n=1 Tax=Strongyloides venezuelensis TaxID=75913 RepID=A0A0K0FN31_STRVS
MTTVIIKLIENNKTKLLESRENVMYSNILSVYESLVPPRLHIGNSNLLFINSKGDIFQINSYDLFWSYIDMEYPNAKDNIFKVPLIVISVIVDNSTIPYNSNLPVHKNITCDVCDNTITDIHYKRSTRHDYDLCQNCEELNNHNPPHIMLSFIRPKDTTKEVLLKNFNELKIENKVPNESSNNTNYQSSSDMNNERNIYYESFENDMNSSRSFHLLF